MKNMKKVLAVMTAVSAMAASTSAFADPIAVTFDVANFGATYDVETNKFAVTLTDYTAAEDMTLLILDKAVEDETNVKDTEIRYIDQGKAFTNAGLKLDVVDDVAVPLAPGSYPVKLGYDDGDSFEIAEATLVIPEAGSGDEKSYIKIVFGDINNGAYTGTADTDISKVTAADALDIILATNGGTKVRGGIANIGAVVEAKDGTKFVFGDVNNGAYTGTADTDLSVVTAADALDIILATNGGTKVRGGIANIGAVIEVVDTTATQN